MDKAVDKVLERLFQIEEKFTKRFDALEEKFEGITERVVSVEKRIAVLEEKTENLSLLESKYKNAIKRTNVAGVMTEYKSRELNVVFSNIPQENETEPSSRSFELAHETIKTVLGIPESVALTHAHRLPKGGSACKRPLIVKVKDTLDKDKLWDAVKRKSIENYNKNKENHEKRYVEMVHLPKKLFIDKMSLKAGFKKAKQAGKSVHWKLDPQNAEYCYKIGAVWYRPNEQKDDVNKD